MTGAAVASPTALEVGLHGRPTCSRWPRTSGSRASDRRCRGRSLRWPRGQSCTAGAGSRPRACRRPPLSSTRSRSPHWARRLGLPRSGRRLSRNRRGRCERCGRARARARGERKGEHGPDRQDHRPANGERPAEVLRRRWVDCDFIVDLRLRVPTRVSRPSVIENPASAPSRCLPAGVPDRPPAGRGHRESVGDIVPSTGWDCGLLTRRPGGHRRRGRSLTRWTPAIRHSRPRNP